MKINPLMVVQHYDRDILESPGMEMSKGFMQHGDTSVFAHSLAVALICVQIAYFLPKFLSKHLNKQALAVNSDKEPCQCYSTNPSIIGTNGAQYFNQ